LNDSCILWAIPNNQIHSLSSCWIIHQMFIHTNIFLNISKMDIKWFGTCTHKLELNIRSHKHYSIQNLSISLGHVEIAFSDFFFTTIHFIIPFNSFLLIYKLWFTCLQQFFFVINVTLKKFEIILVTESCSQRYLHDATVEWWWTPFEKIKIKIRWWLQQVHIP